MDDIEGLLELDEEKEVMIITDENEMGQVRPLIPDNGTLCFG